MKRRVVVTGLGAVSAHGMTVDVLWDDLVNARPAIRPLQPPYDCTRIKIGAMVPEFDSESFFSADDLPLLDRYSQFAVIAAREAVADAGLADDAETLAKAAAIIGSGCGAKQTDEETYEKLYNQGAKRAHPMTIPRGMPSAAASMVSIHLGVKGPVYLISSACASGAHAIIQGCMMIQSGITDVVICGATDAPFTYGLLKSWDALRVTTSDTCRPFCKDRSGIVLGEGAGMLVLESEDHASSRQAKKIYAAIDGFGMSADAGHITRPDVAGIKRSLVAAISSADAAIEDIDYINAHGTGTAANDIAETEAIKDVFGKHADSLAISSTKSMHGHALGASSALEIIATILACHHSTIPPTANFTNADELCDLDYTPNTSREMKIDYALSNSFAFGGLNAVVLVRSLK